MKGRQFLPVAELAAQESSEEWWRTAAGRAYYALFQEAREALIRWGVAGVPTYQAHAFIRTRYRNARNADLTSIGTALEKLFDLRNLADYEIDRPGPFHSYLAADSAVHLSEDAILLLDDIEADAARRSAAITASRAVP